MALLLLIVKVNAAERVGIVLARGCGGQQDRMIRTNSRGSIDGVGVTPPQADTSLGARDEERAAGMKNVQTGKINVGAIHDVEGVGLGHNGVQYVDVVQLSVGNLNKSGDWAPHIQEGMQFDGGLPRPKPRPRKHRQAKIDGRGIESVHGVVKIEAKRLGSIHRAGNVDEHLREVGEDSPGVSLVGIGQCGSGNPASNAHVIKLAGDRSQASFDIAQTLAVGQLSKCQAKELIETGKATEFIASTVPLDALVELVGWDVIDQLRENDAAEMHASACRMLQYRPSTGENAPKPSAEVEIEKSRNTLHATEQTGLTQGSKCDSRTAVICHIVGNSLLTFEQDLRCQQQREHRSQKAA